MVARKKGWSAVSASFVPWVQLTRSLGKMFAKQKHERARVSTNLSCMSSSPNTVCAISFWEVLADEEPQTFPGLKITLSSKDKGLKAIRMTGTRQVRAIH